MGQKLVENAKIQIFKCDILGDFQTLYQSCFLLLFFLIIISFLIGVKSKEKKLSGLKIRPIFYIDVFGSTVQCIEIHDIPGNQFSFTNALQRRY